jgi:hypothetical protein
MWFTIEAMPTLPTDCQFCKVAHKLTVPTVHLNGTSAKDLAADLKAAVDAVATAMEKLAAAAPNGRDYYVQEAGATERVMAQHQLRMDNLRAVHTELSEMLGHVYAVADYQESRRGK